MLLFLSLFLLVVVVYSPEVLTHEYDVKLGCLNYEKNYICRIDTLCRNFPPDHVSFPWRLCGRAFLLLPEPARRTTPNLSLAAAERCC